MTEQIKTKESRLKGLLKSLGVIALVLILFFGMQFVVTWIARGIGLTDMMLKGEVPLDFIYYPDLVDDVSLALDEIIAENVVLMSLISNLLVILILCLSFTLKKKSPVDGMDVKSISVLRFVSLILFGLALQVFVSLAMSFIPIPEELFNEHESSYALLGNESLFLQILSTGIITGITEELVFRGVIAKRLRQHLPPVAAVIISAVIFGLVHPTILSMVYATVLGLILGALYIKYDSVIPSIICHAAFNSMSCLLSLITEDTAIILVIIIFVSVPLLIYLTKSIFFNYPSAGDLLFDDKGRIKPRSEEEAEIIARLKALKATGEITEKDFKRIDQDWERAKKAKKGKKKAAPAPAPVTEEAPDITAEANEENKGDSNNDEAL